MGCNQRNLVNEEFEDDLRILQTFQKAFRIAPQSRFRFLWLSWHILLRKLLFKRISQIRDETRLRTKWHACMCERKVTKENMDNINSLASVPLTDYQSWEKCLFIQKTLGPKKGSAAISQSQSITISMQISSTNVVTTPPTLSPYKKLWKRTTTFGEGMNRSTNVSREKLIVLTAPDKPKWESLRFSHLFLQYIQV